MLVLRVLIIPGLSHLGNQLGVPLTKGGIVLLGVEQRVLQLDFPLVLPLGPLAGRQQPPVPVAPPAAVRAPDLLAQEDHFSLAAINYGLLVALLDLLATRLALDDAGALGVLTRD